MSTKVSDELVQTGEAMILMLSESEDWPGID